MKNRCSFFTVVSSDWYQYFIPMYLYTIARAYPDAHTEIHIRRGSVAAPVFEANLVNDSTKFTIIERMYGEFPEQESLTNSLRFLFTPVRVDANVKYALITDIDFLFFPNDPDLFNWHLAEMGNRISFCGHHGPNKYPFRPEINGGRWSGDYERVAGGFVMVEKDKWYPATSRAREMHARMIKAGKRETYREADEVMLARIIKESGLQVPQSKYFPPELRGIHLGDFKPSMNHRWTNQQKMVHKLPNETIEKYLIMRKEEKWQTIIKILRKCQEIDTILQNIDTHIQERGF